MDHFEYRHGALYCEDVDVHQVAAAAGTPVYLYSRATLLEHYRRVEKAFAALHPLTCYSIKSCSNLAICRLLAEAGAGMDVVSGGELHRALAAGVAAEKCVYAGVGKSDGEIRAALRAGIGWFNVESEAEFENLADLAAQERRLCRCALRVNPDVDPRTHRYTTTGKKETKFGVDLERAERFFEQYGRSEWARLEGIHLHIGSPVYRVEPYVESITRAIALIDALAARGFAIRMLDLGGGYGADYETGQSPSAQSYADAIVPLLRSRVERGLQIVLEPGRSIACNAGVLLVRVLYTKVSGERTFAICDGGMNVLLRPSHYEAFHFIWPARVESDFVPPRRAKDLDMPGLIATDVVGPLCETGDFLGLDRRLPALERGDLLAVFAAGAYGMSMASRYNSSPLPAEVLVDGTALAVVRKRESYEDLLSHEIAEPAWIRRSAPHCVSAGE